MRWLLLSLVIINVMIMVSLFQAQPKEASIKPVVTSAFPSSIVMLDELETDTPVIQPPQVINKEITPDLNQIEDVSVDEKSLLGESPIDAEIENDNSPEYEPAGKSRVCISITNIEKDDDLNEIIALINKAKINPEIFSEKAYYYWVLLPRIGDITQAMQIIRDMRGRNLDAHLLKNGAHRGGVSTGVFLRETNATRYRDRLRRMGFNVIVEKKERQKYKISISRKDTIIFNDGLYKRLQKDYSFLAITEKAC